MFRQIYVHTLTNIRAYVNKYMCIAYVCAYAKKDFRKKDFITIDFLLMDILTYFFKIYNISTFDIWLYLKKYV